MKPAAIVLSHVGSLGRARHPQQTDLTKIDRTIVKEPKYNHEPYYALIVIGPKAEKRVWLVGDGCGTARE